MTQMVVRSMSLGVIRPLSNVKFRHLWRILCQLSPGTRTKMKRSMQMTNMVCFYEVISKLTRSFYPYITSSRTLLKLVWALDADWIHKRWFVTLLSLYHFTTAVAQHYDTDVHKVYVIRGNSAILKCEVPSYIADFVSVTSWHTDQDETFYPDDKYGWFMLNMTKKTHS